MRNILTALRVSSSLRCPCLFLLLFFLTIVARAEGELTLKFKRTGTTASTVSVSVVDGEDHPIAGATASMTASHEMKATQNAVTDAILCPNVNGNTSPTIVLTFNINGLPEDFRFNAVGLDIHALNAGANYQSNADQKARQFNVAVSQGADADHLQPFASLANIDIAAGVGTDGAVHKVWQAVAATETEAGTSLTVRLTITKGAENLGCFFGLSSLTLSTYEAPQEEPYAPIFQVYKMPCGTRSDHFITQVGISGDGTLKPLDYPLPTLTDGTLTPGTAPTPASWYELFTKDCAVVTRGEDFQLRVQLNAAPEPSIETLHAWFDWNCDGAFDAVEELSMARDMSVTVSVPDSACEGLSRLRLRLNLNGLSGSNSDVYGQILDLQLQVVDAPAAGQLGEIRVRPNDPSRGDVSVAPSGDEEVVLTATPRGNATFVGWKEGHKWCAAASTWTIPRGRGSREFVAVFTVNTQVDTGLSLPTGVTNDDDYYYDMSGRRVLRPSRGVYIHSGRKILR